ncbi:type III secretion system lipochaperone family protein, partial [Vibrio parahaemolyticus VP-48]
QNKRSKQKVSKFLFRLS